MVQEPFNVYGNTYYVGTHGLSAILITSTDGHILIDAALPDTAPFILESIRTLGFDPEDIKLILNSHPHYDHAGGIAAMQYVSGARVAASPASALAIENGNVGPDDPQYAIHFGFPPAVNVERFEPGDTLQVGALRVASHATAGHTPGGTSWSWQACEEDACLEIVYADSQTPVSADGFRFTDSTTYPSAIDDFHRGFEVLEGLSCDILISTHPSAAALWRRLVNGREALIDADACKQYTAKARERLAKRIDDETANAHKRKGG